MECAAGHCRQRDSAEGPERPELFGPAELGHAGRWHAQQPAGPNSGLGRLMFEMKNRFDVYLHDTPSKYAFSRDNRRISHGCIRVEKPRELAALLMQQPIDAINQTIATDRTTRSNLPKPVPIFVVYETAFAGVDGKLEFRADVYGRDGEIGPYLNPERRAVVERGAPYRPGG